MSQTEQTDLESDIIEVLRDSDTGALPTSTLANRTNATKKGVRECARNLRKRGDLKKRPNPMRPRELIHQLPGADPL